MSRRVKRLKETTKDRVLIWIKHCSDVNFGIWIECVECKKWRKSYKYCESHEVEENWRCSMNTLDGGKKGSCDDPEEGVLEDYLEYSPGSIVWAKLEGYPWWPAMVDVDPDIEEYFWSEKNTMSYHVTFLDNHVTRSWISSKCLSPFSRRPLNNRFQKKYFDAISKAEEKANTAIEMTLKERLGMFSFVHLYKGKWPLARDFDTDAEENVHNITDILLEEVDDLDSLNSFDSGMIENNALSEKDEPKRSPTVFQKKKVASSKSSNIHSDDESYKNSCNEPIKKQKSTSSKENPSNNFKMKNKLSVMKMKLLTKSPPSDILGDLGVSPKKTSNKIKGGDVSTNTNAFSPSGSSKKTKSGADNKCNSNSKSNCFDELSKELDGKRAEIPIPLDSEISYINISQRSQGISDLENADNLGNSIEWVVNNFKIPQENEAVEKSKPVSSKKLKTPSSSFENVSSHDNKENIYSMVPASVNKRKKSQKNESNGEKRTQNDTGSEKRKIPFKSVIPKNKEIDEKTQLKNSSSVKKAAFCSLSKTPVNSKINKRKESENLSSSDENANNKRLKPSFQYKVKSNSSLQVKVKKANFKVPLSDTVKILTVPKIADKETVSKSNKIGNDNFDGDSDCDKVIKEKIYSQVNEDLKTKDSLNNLVFHKNNSENCTEEGTDFLLSKDETKSSKSANTVIGVSYAEDKSQNNVFSIKPKVFNKNNGENFTEEDADFSDFLLSKDETKSFDSADTVTDVSNDEKNSKTNGIVSSATNNKDDCFFDILVSDDEC